MNEVPVLIESIASLLTSYTTNSVGIRTSEYKYFRDKGSPTKNIHLYDLVKDSLESSKSQVEKNINKNSKAREDRRGDLPVNFS